MGRKLRDKLVPEAEARVAEAMRQAEAIADPDLRKREIAKVRKAGIVEVAVAQARTDEMTRVADNAKRTQARRRGDKVEPVKRGRPVTVGPKPKGAPLMEGVEYRDRTGRRNPGAVAAIRGDIPRPTKSEINRAVEALAQDFMLDEGWDIYFSVARGSLDATTAQIKALEAIAAYAFGRPKQQLEATVATVSNSLSEAIRRMDAVPAVVMNVAAAGFNDSDDED